MSNYKDSEDRPRVGLLQNSNVPVVDAYLREHPVPYSTTMEVKTDGTARLALTDVEFFADKYILGMFIRTQNGGGTRYSKMGRLLIPVADLDNAFITITQSGSNVVDDHPLSHFVHDPTVSGIPGQYTQIIIDGGMSTGNSFIRFSGPTPPAANKAVELTWIWVYRKTYCVQ